MDDFWEVEHVDGLLEPDKDEVSSELDEMTDARRLAALLATLGFLFTLFGPLIFLSGAYSQLRPRTRHLWHTGCSPLHCR